MLARVQLFARPQFRLDLGALAERFTSKRAQLVLAQATMVTGYLSFLVNPFDGGAALLGLLCEATAIMLYASSRSPREERALSDVARF